MANFRLSQRSRDNLRGVHPDLVAVVEEAIERTEVDFVVTEGMRTLQRQKQLKAEGKSQTLNSRHLTGHAVDVAALVDGQVTWTWAPYEKIAKAFKAAAQDLGVPIVWGGDWSSLKDGPHFELERHAYPADSDIQRRRKLSETSTGKTGAIGIGGTIAAGAAAVADNAPALLESATNPGVQRVVEPFQWGAAILAGLAVFGVALMLIRKKRQEAEKPE